MNRFTNEQHMQIIEFYDQNTCSVKRVHCDLPSFYGQFNRPTEATIWTIVTKFRTKYTFLDIEPSKHLRTLRKEIKILQLYRPVLMMAINYRFVFVRSN